MTRPLIPAVLLLPLALVLLPVSRTFSQQVIQERRPAGAAIVLTDEIIIPAEEAGYTLVLPDTGKARGLVVFFNADRDTGMKIFRDAVARGLGVMFVTAGNRLDFYFDTMAMRQTEKYIHEVLNRHGIPRGNLLYAGMSLAGTRAVKMALFSRTHRSRHRILPRAIALCDAPLDFVRFWSEMDRAKRLKATPLTANEGEWVTGYLERNLGGTPATRPDAYIGYSPYSRSAPDTAALRALREVAVRAYTEPDIIWWMSTRKKDYYGMNSLDMAAFVNELNIAGNEAAELIVTEGKGVLSDGTRHPHSWSIVDEGGLLDWFEGLIAGSGTPE